MQTVENTIAHLGDEPPLVAGGRSGPPDRREISVRWLSGTFLTAVTSSVLMGVALFTALNGREQLALPPETFASGSIGVSGAGEAAKSSRLTPPRSISRAMDRRRMEVSTLIRDGDRDVVRMLPFAQVKMALAAGHSTNRSYPSFDPLQVFADDEVTTPVANTGIIYGAKVESEVSLRAVDFPIDTANFDETSTLSAVEVEAVVRDIAALLTDGDIQVAALPYVDPQRFGVNALDSLSTLTLGASFGIRVVSENVSVAPRDSDFIGNEEYAEDIIPFPLERSIAESLTEAGYSEDDTKEMLAAFTNVLRAPSLKAGHVLRLGIETRDEVSRIVRASVYNGRNHLLTVALNDSGRYVRSSEPEPNPAVLAAFDMNQPVPRARGDLPTIYDGIYRAAYSYGLTRGMTRQLVRLLASDVDFQTRLSASDRVEVFFSQPDENNRATDNSEMLYVKASFGGNSRSFYRYLMEDGSVEYFDEEGRSARQFLLRNPVPNGVFRSGFGPRRHPILGSSRMHTGVDWSAPRGTPIIASGNGVVEKAGWAGGYGRQTIIRHANGYKSSYNHQNAIANGVVEGARVRQGQIIGYVGSTGLSTGNHLHYELIVNNTKVDPMRVRLPNEKSLSGADLENFQRERSRIDALLKENEGAPLKMAGSSISG